MKLKHIFIALAAPLLLTGCFDLDKEPEGVLSTARPFVSTGEIKNYIAQFYETGVRTNNIGAGGGGDIAGADINSDNMVGSAPNTRLAGQLVLSDASALSAYTYIRNVNFLLNNLGNCSEAGTKAYNQLVGEAYYFRAWYYFTMFRNYGPLAWVDRPLDPDMAQMKLPRDSRTVVADHILADLDKAIELLGEQNSSASMRVHRDVARWLKSEVALYEGTWEKYHKAEGDAFYDPAATDAKINDYLKQAADAAKAVIDRGVWQISTDGGTLDSYRRMFQTTNLDNNTEVMWYKRYDGDQVGNSVNRYLNEGGGGFGITASLVDDYLTIDGRPFTGNERLEAKKVWGDELQPTLRDPRLAQTVATPGSAPTATDTCCHRSSEPAPTTTTPRDIPCSSTCRPTTPVRSTLRTRVPPPPFSAAMPTCSSTMPRRSPSSTVQEMPTRLWPHSSRSATAWECRPWTSTANTTRRPTTDSATSTSMYRLYAANAALRRLARDADCTTSCAGRLPTNSL